jgi:hypothetical protein
MATVHIPINELTSFDLPRVCLITGATEDVVFKPVKFSWYPRWVAVFIIFNLIIAAILAMVLTKRAKGELPFTEEAHRRWKRGQTLLALSILAAIGLLFGGIYFLTVDIAPAGLALWVLAVAVPIVVGLKFVRGKRVLCVKIDAQTVSLRIPSESAALAITQHLHAGALAPGAPAVPAIG